MSTSSFTSLSSKKSRFSFLQIIYVMTAMFTGCFVFVFRSTVNVSHWMASQYRPATMNRSIVGPSLPIITKWLGILFFWSRRIAILGLGIQFSLFVTFYLFRLSLSTWNSMLKVFPSTHSLPDFKAWFFYFAFDIMQIGRFPVYFGNVLVVIALIGLIGEYIWTKQKDHRGTFKW